MRRIVKTMTFMLAIILLSYSCSYAAVIQIKDTTAQVLTGGTISDFYVMAEELKGTGQGLEGATVDVKMANNYEWAVVSYFSNSAYGTSGVGKNNGTSVSGHYTTNGNITGVMDWGKTTTYTAGIISDYSSKTLTTAGNLTLDPTISVIKNNASTNKIDKFANLDYNESIAKTKWYNSWSWVGQSGEYPYSMRRGLFGFCGGLTTSGLPNEYYHHTSGASYDNMTFRPVVWN